MDLSLARYFLKWSWLSSTASSRTFLFLSGIACTCRQEKKKRQKKKKKGFGPSAQDVTNTNQKTADQERFPVGRGGHVTQRQFRRKTTRSIKRWKSKKDHAVQSRISGKYTFLLFLT